MDKLKFETPDMVAGNVEKIGALFPAAITEMRGEDGQIKKGINFEVLKQLLSRDGWTATSATSLPGWERRPPWPRPPGPSLRPCAR